MKTHTTFQIVCILAMAALILLSCSKQKEGAPKTRVTASVLAKAGQSNYVVSFKIAGSVKGTVVSGVSWKAGNGQSISAAKTFALNGEQTYQFSTNINVAQYPGVTDVKITTFSAEGYNFTY